MGSGRCTSKAASDAEPDAILGAPEYATFTTPRTEPAAKPQLKTVAWRAEVEVHDIGENTDGSSVVSAIQKKKLKVARDVSPEEEQTIATLVQHQ